MRLKGSVFVIWSVVLFGFGSAAFADDRDSVTRPVFESEGMEPVVRPDLGDLTNQIAVDLHIHLDNPEIAGGVDISSSNLDSKLDGPFSWSHNYLLNKHMYGSYSGGSYGSGNSSGTSAGGTSTTGTEGGGSGSEGKVDTVYPDDYEGDGSDGEGEDDPHSEGHNLGNCNPDCDDDSEEGDQEGYPAPDDPGPGCPFCGTLVGGVLDTVSNPGSESTADLSGDTGGGPLNPGGPVMNPNPDGDGGSGGGGPIGPGPGDPVSRDAFDLSGRVSHEVDEAGGGEPIGPPQPAGGITVSAP